MRISDEGLINPKDRGGNPDPGSYGQGGWRELKKKGKKERKIIKQAA